MPEPFHQVVVRIDRTGSPLRRGWHWSVRCGQDTIEHTTDDYGSALRECAAELLQLLQHEPGETGELSPQARRGAKVRARERGDRFEPLDEF